MWSAHGPVNAGDGELDTLCRLVLVQVHIFKYQREDEFPISISHVQFLHAICGVDVLVGNDR